MSRGSRFPMGMPPMPMPNGNGTPASLTVASPLSDFQMICSMAATLLAQAPAPETVEERNNQGDLAATRAVELYGHVAYRFGRGIIAATARAAINQGEADLKAAVEAEAPQQPDAKIITGEG